MVVLVMSLTDCRYFIPSFTELTTSDVAENRRLLAENGVTYPIGTHYRCWYFGVGNEPGVVFVACVSVCCCCSVVGTLTELCLRQCASRAWRTATVRAFRCRRTAKRYRPHPPSSLLSISISVGRTSPSNRYSFSLFSEIKSNYRANCTRVPVSSAVKS